MADEEKATQDWQLRFDAQNKHPSIAVSSDRTRVSVDNASTWCSIALNFRFAYDDTATYEWEFVLDKLSTDVVNPLGLGVALANHVDSTCHDHTGAAAVQPSGAIDAQSPDSKSSKPAYSSCNSANSLRFCKIQTEAGVGLGGPLTSGTAYYFRFGSYTHGGLVDAWKLTPTTPCKTGDVVTLILNCQWQRLSVLRNGELVCHIDDVSLPCQPVICMSGTQTVTLRSSRRTSAERADKLHEQYEELLKAYIQRRGHRPDSDVSDSD